LRQSSRTTQQLPHLALVKGGPTHEARGMAEGERGRTVFEDARRDDGLGAAAIGAKQARAVGAVNASSEQSKASRADLCVACACVCVGVRP